jgi:hypothetical protein
VSRVSAMAAASCGERSVRRAARTAAMRSGRSRPRRRFLRLAPPSTTRRGQRSCANARAGDSAVRVGGRRRRSRRRTRALGATVPQRSALERPRKS